MENTDSTWIEHVLNPKTITSIYPAQAPSLAQVRLGKLSILCSGSLQCRLHFEFKGFPGRCANQMGAAEVQHRELVPVPH